MHSVPVRAAWWRVGKDALAPRRLLARACLLLAGALAFDAGWLHAKAWLAQQLLQRAWVQRGEGAAKPWPWADTAPVARLRAPQLGIDQIVLSGDSGRTLAFGPGWAEASARPGAHGTTVISGHRDTHFAFLQQLRAGDVVELESTQGTRRWRVQSTRVADSRDTRIALDGDDALLLVTCWPFDAVVPGGPLRWVVRAEPEPAGVRIASARAGTAPPSQAAAAGSTATARSRMASAPAG